MGQILGRDIVLRARVDLSDPNATRWSDQDLLNYLNDGQREIAILKPDASTALRVFPLAVGSTAQALPNDALRLIDITRNMGADGGVPGRAITIAQREDLDQGEPTWHSQTGAYVTHYVYNDKSPKVFYVWRAPNAPLQIEAHVSIVPADVTMNGVAGSTANSAISLDDVYQTALLDYLMMRAHMKDTDARADMESNAAYGRFLQRLGLKVQTDRANDPNRRAPPEFTSPEMARAQR